VPLALKAVASQSANTLELQNSSGSPITYFTASGRAVIGSDSSAMLNVVANATAVVPLVIKGASGQSANLFETRDSASNIRFYVDSVGNANFSSATFIQNSTGKMIIGLSSAAAIGLVVKGAASQSANLQEWQDSGAGTASGISSAGSFFTTGRVSVGFTSAQVGTKFISQPGVATDVGAIIRGAASQSANLQEWQNSAGTVIAKVDSAGTLSTQNINGLNSTVMHMNPGGTNAISLFTTPNFQFFNVSGSFGGGTKVIGIANATTVPSSNPTGGGVLFVNSGALQYRGTSGANTTIVNADGTITAPDATVATASTGVGYMGLPQNTITTGAYTIVAGDAGEHVYASATRTITIPANSALALPIGTTLTFIAGTGATMTIAITTDTMYLAGAGTTGSRTLAAYGIATAVKTTATTWIISGNGLT
jgi:hypothetical protein